MRRFFRNLFSRPVALVAVPLLLFAAGCDGGGSDNDPPVPSISASVSGLTVNVDASASTDSDGEIASYEWAFGDGAGTATGPTASYTYDGSVGDTYEVSLTVTDDEGASASTTQEITLGGGAGASVVNYDTTGTTITITEQEAEGIAPVDAGGNKVGDTPDEVTWTSDYTYILNGRVFVNDGQTLNIEPGTVIQGRNKSAPELETALIVARGGQIFAEGTADNPILFTAEGDNVSSSTDPGSLPYDTRGQWGGVIILGTAELNSTPGYSAIEGIPQSGTGADPRGTYGCGDEYACDNEDDSGVFKYVSIRHGGVSIGANNEINGLSMGGVGSGTEIHHVEVSSNQDDGFEWFGGTVNTHHLVSAFNGDDGFDIDEGYRGLGQFFFLVQAPDAAGNGGEHDGGTDPEGAQPYATPHVYNATSIGGANSDLALYFRDNFAGSYYNSVFMSFPGAAIEVEDRADTDAGDSRARFEEELIRVESNLFYDFGAGDTFEALTQATADNDDKSFADAFANYLADNNDIMDPQLVDPDVSDGSLNPLPASGSPALSGAMDVLGSDSDFIEQTDYVGAFGSDNWAAGWTFLDAAGYFE